MEQQVKFFTTEHGSQHHTNQLLAKVNIGSPTMESVTNHLVGNVDVTPMEFGCRCVLINTKINDMLSNNVLYDTDVRDLYTLMTELGIRDQWKEMNAKIRTELEGITTHVTEASKVLDANPPEFKWVNQHYGCGSNFMVSPIAVGPVVFAKEESVAQKSAEVQQTTEAAAEVVMEQQTVQAAAEEVVEAAEPEPVAAEVTVEQNTVHHSFPMFRSAIPVVETVPVVQIANMVQTAPVVQTVEAEQTVEPEPAAAEVSVEQATVHHSFPMFRSAIPVVETVPVVQTANIVQAVRVAQTAEAEQSVESEPAASEATVEQSTVHHSFPMFHSTFPVIETVDMVQTVPVVPVRTVEYKPVVHKEVRFGMEKPKLISMPFEEWNSQMNKQVASVRVGDIIPVKKQVVERRLFGEWDALMEDVVEWHKRGLQKFIVRMCLCVSEPTPVHCQKQ